MGRGRGWRVDFVVKLRGVSQNLWLTADYVVITLTIDYCQ